MRSLIVLLGSGCAGFAFAADANDCKDLAQSYASAPEQMTPLDLAKARNCVDDRTWAAERVPEASTKDPKSVVSPSGQQATTCQSLSNHFAEEGPGSLTVMQRSVLRKCIDDSITSASTKRKPGAAAGSQG